MSVFEVGASAPVTPNSWNDSQAQAYVPRRDDAALMQMLLADDADFVLVVGPSKAGKSRSAFEAIKHAFPDRRLIVPSGRESLGELCRLDPPFDFSGSIVWLDDLETYVGDASDLGLTRQLIHEVSHAAGALVVATMRRHEYEKYDSRGGDVAREIEDLLEAARTLPLDPLKTLPDNLALANREFAEEVERFGLGAALVEGPKQVRLLLHSGDPFEKAVVMAIIDHRRAGAGPASEQAVREIYPAYLPDSVAASPEGFARGMESARHELWPDAGVSLVAVEDRGPPPLYTVTDYLLDFFADRGIPESTWTVVVQNASPSYLLRVGIVAYLMANSGEGAARG